MGVSCGECEVNPGVPLGPTKWSLNQKKGGALKNVGETDQQKQCSGNYPKTLSNGKEN